MILVFNKVIIHNFLSYGHAEIDLRGKQYCTVQGVNRDKRDNAASNGSGKSSWGSAICYALCGETIQGVKSNIKNINVEEESCFVTLDFNIDNDNYIITREKEPKSNLTLIYNGTDISGKGLRESEDILKNRLPDLTSQLIGSIIILGQGLPYKFTDNTPSGRKEVLEKLSKCDFMIQDLKDRIGDRSSELEKQLREIQDKITADTANQTLMEQQLKTKQAELEKLSENKDFDSLIKDTNVELTTLTAQLTENQSKADSTNSKIIEINNQMSELTAVHQKAKYALTEKYEVNQRELIKIKADLTAKCSSLKQQITQLKNIVDICPTCGQKIPNVIKPDTSKQEEELETCQTELEKIEKNYTGNETLKTKEITQLEKQQEDDLKQLKYAQRQLYDSLDVYNSQIKALNLKITQLSTQLTALKLEKESYMTNLQNVKTSIEEYTVSLKKIQEQILYNIMQKDEITKHTAVLNQMSTLVKRDFRGYLLTNVIQFLNRKVKEYAAEIGLTQDLNVELKGNNIEITYLNKPFEVLSGGEKQKVDLIIQFSLRDMLREYFGFSSNILLLDEIFDGLDAFSVKCLLNCICNKFTDVESLFIISHRGLELDIPYDSQMTVIKDENGITSVNIIS